MYKVNMQKVLVLLFAVVIYTNYQNYIKADASKLHREVLSLETNIAREKAMAESNYTKETLLISHKDIILDGKKFSYSQAMGEMQNQITESAKGNCTLGQIKWAQVPNTKEWYDKLRMNISLSCSPNDFMHFTNALKQRPTLYNVENFRATKDRNNPVLNINLQLVAYRTHK